MPKYTPPRPRKRMPKDNWTGRPKIVLKTDQVGPYEPPPKSKSPKPQRSSALINVNRSIYRNKLVQYCIHLSDQLTHNTYSTLRLELLHTRDQIYGLTVGQLEELVYVLQLLNQLQHHLDRNQSKQAAARWQSALKRLKKGLVLE